MWHWGPSKVENLDIIDSYAGRSGIPIRTRRNVLECSEMTSGNSLEGPTGSRTQISAYHHHKYRTIMFLIIPLALFIFHYAVLIFPVCVSVRACPCVAYMPARLCACANPQDKMLCRRLLRRCWFTDSYPSRKISRREASWLGPRFIMRREYERKAIQSDLQQKEEHRVLQQRARAQYHVSLRLRQKTEAALTT